MKTMLKLITVLALANLLAGVGFIGWLYSSGRVDVDRLERVRDLFKPTIAQEKSEQDKADELEAKNGLDAAEIARLRELPMSSGELISSSHRFTDRATLAMRTLDEQQRRMQDDLRTRENSVTDRESALARRQKEWEASIAAELERETAEQFRKAVRLLEAAPAKQAREWILELVNTDRAPKAVEYLDAMNPAKSAGILKALKGEGESKVATDLLERLRMLGLESEASAERTDDANPAEPTAKSASRASASGAPRASGPVSNGEVALPQNAEGRSADGRNAGQREGAKPARSPAAGSQAGAPS